MFHSTSLVVATELTLGLDVGDKLTHFCAVNGDRKVTARGAFATTREALTAAMAAFPGAKVMLEAGSQSRGEARK